MFLDIVTTNPVPKCMPKSTAPSALKELQTVGELITLFSLLYTSINQKLKFKAGDQCEIATLTTSPRLEISRSALELHADDLPPAGRACQRQLQVSPVIGAKLVHMNSDDAIRPAWNLPQLPAAGSVRV